MFILNIFQLFFAWNQEKTLENLWKNWVLSYSLKLIDMQTLVDSLREYLKFFFYRLIFNLFNIFLSIFSWFCLKKKHFFLIPAEKSLKPFEMNKKGWKRPRKVFQPALGACSTWKLVERHNNGSFVAEQKITFKKWNLWKQNRNLRRKTSKTKIKRFEF